MATTPAKATPTRQALPTNLAQAGYKSHLDGSITAPDGSTFKGNEALANATTNLQKAVNYSNSGLQPSGPGGGSSGGASAPVAAGGVTSTTPGSGVSGTGGTSTTTPASAGPAQGGSLNNTNALNPSSLLSSNINPLFQNIANQGTTGVTQDFNTAANRLRERTDAATAGNVTSVQDKNLSRGFGNSGANNADVTNAKAAGTSTYAQGLNDLSNSFEQNKIAGLNTALGATNGEAQNSNTEDTTLYGLLNNDNSQNSQQQIANNSNSTQKSIDQANNSNTSNIAQLQQLMTAWMAAQNQGSAY